ncbi:MAG TPA: exopolysaccharide biosynthesis protein, partial [Dokdonella sp.]
MNSPSEPSTPGSARSRGNGIARLLQSFAHGDPQELLTMDGLLQGLGRTAFGMFLFVAILPGFIPIPGAGGVVAGPLVVLIGLQLL